MFVLLNLDLSGLESKLLNLHNICTLFSLYKKRYFGCSDLVIVISVLSICWLHCYSNVSSIIWRSRHVPKNLGFEIVLFSFIFYCLVTEKSIKRLELGSRVNFPPKIMAVARVQAMAFWFSTLKHWQRILVVTLDM